MSGETKETIQAFDWRFEEELEEDHLLPANPPWLQWRNGKLLFHCEHRRSGNKCVCGLARGVVLCWGFVVIVFLAVFSIYILLV